MMTLHLMQAVVATVNEHWESPLVDEILHYWEHEGQAKFWRASTNFIFFFKQAGQDCVLRFNHADERTVATIEAEIDFVNGVAQQGIHVAKPIVSRNGRYVESVATALGTFHAVAFAALQGKQFEVDELMPAQFVQWGRTLGMLHNASAQLSVSTRPTWQNHLTMVAEIVPAEEIAARQTLETLQQTLAQLPVTAANFGLIHYDFELDNLIWQGETAGIIDFDDSAWYWYVADIALALGDVWGDRTSDVDLQHPSFLHFIEGYRSVRPLAQEEIDRIPLFLRMDALVTFAKLQRALTPVNPSGELPWMAGLRDKLAAKMQLYREVFSDGSLFV